jgi:hypothetical protein
MYVTSSTYFITLMIFGETAFTNCECLKMFFKFIFLSTEEGNLLRGHLASNPVGAGDSFPRNKVAWM